MDIGDGHGRDILVAVAVVGGILLALYLYTGTWPPPVVVESNSMMHVDKAEYDGNYGDTRADGVPYGRIGTIDPGDLVLVKDVDGPPDVSTFADGEDGHFGKPGEVVVYFTNDRKAGTPIIHRALTYVQVEGQGDARTYEVRWTDAWDASRAQECFDRDDRRICRFDQDGVTIPELSLRNEAFTQSGFITKGDNDAGNPAPDQKLGIYAQPVPMDQVQGVARGELPWFGLIKLTLTGNPSSTMEVQDHPYYHTFGRMTAPQDLWVMLLVGLVAVAVAPVALDYGLHYGQRWFEKRSAAREPEPEVTPPSTPAGPAAGDPPDPEESYPDAEEVPEPSPAEPSPAEPAEPAEEAPPGSEGDDDSIELDLE